MITDHTRVFEETFMGKRFSSFAQFTEKLREFESSLFVRFVIRSSVISNPGDPCFYHSVFYECSYADWGKQSTSLGIRRGRWKDRGCGARFSLNQRDGYLQIGPRCHYMQHNHECRQTEYLLDRSVRRLSTDEKADVLRMMKYGTPMSGIRKMIRREYHKLVTRRDMWNLRAEYAETAVPGASWVEFAEVVGAGGRFVCSADVEGRMQCVSFRLDAQGEIFAKFPEVVCLDATYKVNCNKYCLLQYVVTDGLGHGRSVMYSLLRSESVMGYTTALQQFCELMGNTGGLKTFVVDMHYAQLKALVTVFGGKDIILCHFHMLRAIRRKTKNIIIRRIMRRMMRTNSRAAFSSLCNGLRRRHPAFYIYFLQTWLRRAELWAVCWTRQVVTLGNLTNNRVEVAHRWLKRDLCASDTLFHCCKRLYLCAQDTICDYGMDVALSRIRLPVIPSNCAIAGLIPQLTRYAAEKLLREWEKPGSITVPDGDSVRLQVVEYVGSRQLAHSVNLRSRRCSCMFNRFHMLPCRHLLMVYLKRRIPLQKAIDRSRWLDRNLDGVEQTEVEPQVPHCTARKSGPEVTLLRRLPVIKKTVSEGQYRQLLGSCSSLFDFYQYILWKEESDTLPIDNIPPLVSRILQSSPQPSTSQPTLPTEVSKTCTTSRPGGVMEPVRRNKKRHVPVDIDESDKENREV